jgi:hypothetical protein
LQVLVVSVWAVATKVYFITSRINYGFYFILH